MGGPSAANNRRSAPRVPLWRRLTPPQQALVVVALAAAVVLLWGDKLIEPFAKGFALSSELVRAEEELRRLDAENAALRLQAEHLQTPEGLKLEIREATGQVAPGEYLLHVVIPPPPEGTQSKPVPWLRAQGLDTESIALAIRDSIAHATEVFLRWAGVAGSENKNRR